MTTTIIINSLKELKTVAYFFGIQINSLDIFVLFPYRLEIEHQIYTLENDEMTFEEFRLRYL